MEKSSFVKFVESIKNTGIDKASLIKKFNRSVDKTDYSKEDRPSLLKWLCEISKK